MTLQILDIYADNAFDADKEKATGTDGVIIKLGQGQYPEYLDKRCDYIDECKRVGLPWGLYWLVDARYSPESQKAAIKMAYPKVEPGVLGLWLDCEKPVISMKDSDYMKLPYAYYKPIESVWRGVEAAFGFYPGFYTSPGAWNLIFSACPTLLQQEFATKSPLWTAQYNSSITKPNMYGAWTKAVMWQYMEGPDFSIADESWYNMVAGATQVPPPVSPPPVTPPPVVQQVTVTSVDVHLSDGRVVTK